MNTPNPVPSTSRCPLCGEDNRCAVDIERETGVPPPPCWCLGAAFPADLLQRVPVWAQGRACVCAACAAAHAWQEPSA